MINKLRTRGLCVAALLSTLALSACRLETSPIPSFSRALSPEIYCPGDTLTASYDFLRSDSCPAGIDCSSYFPTVSMTSGEGLFMPQSFRAYSGSFNFPSAGDSVSVVFNTSNTTVLIPTERFDSGGARIFLQRTGYRPPETRTATLFTDQQQDINHLGMCAGASPAYSAGVPLTAPEVSSRLVANGICNTSTVPIIATIVYPDVPGVIAPPLDIPLGLRECRDIPRSDVAPVQIRARPQMMDLSARCGALDGGSPPRGLSTRLSYMCR